MKVRSCATSSLLSRQAKPGMPRGEGAAAMPGSELPANTTLISEFGSSDSTVEFPAIFGNTFGLPSPSVRWHAALMRSSGRPKASR